MLEKTPHTYLKPVDEAAQEVGDRSGGIAVVANKTFAPINSPEEVPRAPGTRARNPRPLRSPATS